MAQDAQWTVYDLVWTHKVWHVEGQFVQDDYEYTLHDGMQS